MNILDLVLKEVARRGSDLKDSMSKLQESLNAILEVIPEEERASVLDAVLNEIRIGLAGQVSPLREKKDRRGRPRKTAKRKKKRIPAISEAGKEAEGTVEAEIPEKKKRKKRRKKKKVSAKQAQ